MWIGSYKLKKNIRLPNYIIEHVKRLTQELKNEMVDRLGTHYKIYLKFSVHSEASYITISKGTSSYKISIRNHTTIDNTFDKAYYLENYSTWEEFKNNFFSKELSMIQKELNDKKALIK